MTFSQDQNLERGNQDRKETDIFSNNFGGLNTLASSLNCPYDDSPLLWNTEVQASGVLNKRKGTRVVYKNESPGTLTGVAVVPFTTGLGYNYIVTKQSTDLKIYSVQDNVTTLLMTKANVWNSEAATIRPTFVRIPEVEPRIVFCTGVNTPVQLYFVEQQQNTTAGAPTTTIATASARRFKNASTSNLLVYKDRVLQTGWSVSYNSGTEVLTVSGLPSYTGSATFDFIYIYWEWFTEALLYYGDRFFQATTRLALANAQADPDQNVPVPVELRDGILPSAGNYYPLVAYKSNAFNDKFTFSNTYSPGTHNDYSHGDGAVFDPAVGGTMNPSPLFISFGPNNTGSTVENKPIFISRIRTILMNGSTGIIGSNLTVLINGIVKTQNTNAAASIAQYGAYYLYDTDRPDPLTVINTSTATVGKAISFQGGINVGTNRDSIVELHNTEVKNIGSGANNSKADYRDGNYYPVYGLGLFSNYATGSHPRNVSLYQGRLVFGGFPEQPLTLVFSNVYDSVTPGVNYTSFQVDPLAVLDTDPLDLTLAGQPDDTMKGLMEWQNSLFALTRKAVFRISGNNNILTQKNKFVIYVSSLGLVNSYSVCRTDKSILYVSDTGVYDLQQTFESNEYSAAEKSLKIRDKFGITLNPAYELVSWIAFDNTRQLVFLGYPETNNTKTSYRLYVYNTFRESWTEWTTPGGFNAYMATTYVDRSLGFSFMLACSRYFDNSGNPTDLIFLKFYNDRYVDFAEYYSNPSSGNFNNHPKIFASHTTTDRVQEYATTLAKTGQWRGFEMFPMTTVEDAVVTLNGVRQTFDTDWVKLPNGNIFLRNNPGAGKTLVITMRRPVTESDAGQATHSVMAEQDYHHDIVFLNNLPIRENQGYTTNVTGTNPSIHRINVASIAANSVLIIGTAYPVIYTSPIFNLGSLANFKRLKHAYLHFDNTLGLDSWQPSDVNTAAGQTAEELVGQPKYRHNASIAIRYDADDNTEDSYDIYDYSTLLWDDAVFDADPPAYQYRKNALFKEALQGIGYSYQLLVWSFDETTFTFSGYQIVPMTKGERYISWNK